MFSYDEKVSDAVSEAYSYYVSAHDGGQILRFGLKNGAPLSEIISDMPDEDLVKIYTLPNGNVNPLFSNSYPGLTDVITTAKYPLDVMKFIIKESELESHSIGSTSFNLDLDKSLNLRSNSLLSRIFQSGIGSY